MNQVALNDETDSIHVEIQNLEVVSLRISNAWRDRFETNELAEAISLLIRGALPPREKWSDPTSASRHLPQDSVPGFLAEIRAGNQAMRRYVDRRRSGEATRVFQERYVDPRERVEVLTVGGRFWSVALNPEWAKTASAQCLSDTILDALPKPLSRAMDVDPDFAQAKKHYAAARSLLIEK